MARSLFPFVFGGSQFDPLWQFRRDVDRLVDEVFGAIPTAAGEGGAVRRLVPDIDIEESEEELRICADLPGVAAEDVSVDLAGDLLTIRGERRAEGRTAARDYHLAERSYGSFARAIRLPFAADPEQVAASFENGVLTVSVPNSAVRQKVRRIAVRGAAPSLDRAAAGDKPAAAGGQPGIMGDGTEEQNLGQPGDPAARISEDEAVAAFGQQAADEPGRK